MKLTDLALVFVGITLPIIIIVYVNVSYTIKAQEQEMYYKKMINIATQDAANQMKEVENTDQTIDYGYSGIEDKKVSINPQIALDTFLNSLYKSFNIKGNKNAEEYLRNFIPAVAIIDYDGVYVASQENDNQYIIRPKKYYSYTYYENGNKIEDYKSQQIGNKVHTVEFTMDDYITHRGYENISPKTFYLNDSANNSVLGNNIQNITKQLEKKRKTVITETIVNEINYAINKANTYARNVGISYSFTAIDERSNEMESAIENIGVFGFIQGVNIGNRYLNAKSYGIAKLEQTTKYYFSIYNNSINHSKFNANMYHNTTECPEYKVSYHNGDGSTSITPAYVQTKQKAASAVVAAKINGAIKENNYEGFYPCPICNP